MVKINEIIFWKPLYAVSLIMLAMFGIAFPFSQVWAMIILFSIISLWSRVIPMSIPFAREIDVIDFFVLIIAVNIGPLPAAIFGVFNMLFSRLFSSYENIHYTLKDTFAYLVGAFVLPFTYYYTGSLLITIYVFVILRFLIRFAITLLFDRHCLGEEIAVIAGSVPIALIFNGILIALFGPMTTRMLTNGIMYTNDIILMIIVILLIPTSIIIATNRNFFKSI